MTNSPNITCLVEEILKRRSCCLLIFNLIFLLCIFNRKQGGVFIRDIGSGKTLLGHRGIVTRGKVESAP